MNLILFDDRTRNRLLPLTFTRPVAEIRIGILTIREKWEHITGKKVCCLSTHCIEEKYSFCFEPGKSNIFINGSVCPDASLSSTILGLSPGRGLKQQDKLIAFNSNEEKFDNGMFLSRSEEYSGDLLCVDNVWDIFSKNGEAIKKDFEMITAGRKSESLSDTNKVIGTPNLVFLEEGARAEGAIFNTTAGPIYLGKNAEVMEGSVIRGPFALCEESVLKMSAKVYGPTTIGPHSKVGGEVNNSVIFGYSNKAHDGFLGNSVIGEWCNLGADTNNSNLKNNYSSVKLYSYVTNKAEDTGMQFCGLIMGDHSKAGINTMFNTGTVVGVGANIFGGGFPPTHIPSFSWGGATGFETYRLEKMFETADRVLSRRHLSLSKADKNILSSVFEETKDQRTWEQSAS
jgi:UDP-N-acetylglucosamine diphosphorylase/glucosamine-1-phosphate N-acetyltransferase